MATILAAQPMQSQAPYLSMSQKVINTLSLSDKYRKHKVKRKIFFMKMKIPSIFLANCERIA